MASENARYGPLVALAPRRSQRWSVALSHARKRCGHVPMVAGAQSVADLRLHLQRELRWTTRATHGVGSSAPGPGSRPADRAQLVQRMRATSTNAGASSIA